ncbi:hypothetical protein M7I_7380 [Glarea lozoyensis 74030]|uniref:Uncharacterized protein n=1 Tax=Glarea lozoyensis (strain ATCC 74030 / MF5533) TaxID=1104152 RepID=H0EX55_GLAL7|nr:hypothetical protein M7I_7380 [Glarea lozoyensis 74030]
MKNSGGYLQSQNRRQQRQSSQCRRKKIILLHLLKQFWNQHRQIA